MRAVLAGRGPFRTWLSAWLVGLLLMMSGAACAAYAAPAQGVAVSAPADPCLAGKTAPAAPVSCAQCACQTMGQPPGQATSPSPQLQRAQFDLSVQSLSGRLDAPPTPPPRHPMS